MSRSCQFQEIFFLLEYLHQDNRYIYLDKYWMTVSVVFFWWSDWSIDMPESQRESWWRHCPHVNLSNGQSAGGRRQEAGGRGEDRFWPSPLPLIADGYYHGGLGGWPVTRPQLVSLDNPELSSHHMSSSEKNISAFIKCCEVRWVGSSPVIR